MAPQQPSDKPFNGAGLTYNFEVEDVDSEYARLTEAGLTTIMPIGDHPWGDRGFALQDPNGVVLYIYTPIERSATRLLSLETAMDEILQKLQGGDLRSIGRTNEVVKDILNDPELFPMVFDGIFSHDPRIRMRAADQRYRPRVISVLNDLTESGSAAVKARGRTLLKRLTGPGR